MPSMLMDYQCPSKCEAHALHDTTTCSDRTIAFQLVVTTAGTIIVQMWGDAGSTTLQLGVGTWIIPGNWKLLKTGGTAVITGTPVIFIADPSGLRV